MNKIEQALKLLDLEVGEVFSVKGHPETYYIDECGTVRMGKYIADFRLASLLNGMLEVLSKMRKEIRRMEKGF